MATSKQQQATLKRKASLLNQRPTKPKLQKPLNHGGVSFPFMDLPAELRNMVYAEVARYQTAHLVRTNLTDDSPLSQVSTQIHEEYIPILALNAKAIKTDVLDFDFRHIVTFINRLSAAELSALPTITQPNSRSITVVLHFSDRVAWPDDYLLRRWLNRAGSTTKKGTTLDFKYSLVLPPGRSAMWDTGYWAKRRRWQMVHDVVATSKDGRAKEEAVKMQAEFERKR